jgi:hypothetical protein
VGALSLRSLTASSVGSLGPLQVSTCELCTKLDWFYSFTFACTFACTVSQRSSFTVVNKGMNELISPRQRLRQILYHLSSPRLELSCAGILVNSGSEVTQSLQTNVAENRELFSDGPGQKSLVTFFFITLTAQTTK